MSHKNNETCMRSNMTSNVKSKGSQNRGLSRQSPQHKRALGIPTSNSQSQLHGDHIQTKYLAETDLNELKKGITVYSKAEVNKKLEDFE